MAPTDRVSLSATQALTAVRAMRYPQKVGASDAEPKGLRGTDPRLAARYWSLSRSDYIEGADIWRLDPPNGNLLPWILIESPRGVANVREIARRLKAKNVGAVLFAGSETGGDMLSTHGGDLEAVAKAIDAILAAGKEFGFPVAMTNTANMKQRIAQGARLFTNGVTPALLAGSGTLARGTSVERARRLVVLEAGAQESISVTDVAEVRLRAVKQRAKKQTPGRSKGGRKRQPPSRGKPRGSDGCGRSCNACKQPTSSAEGQHPTSGEHSQVVEVGKRGRSTLALPTHLA